MVITMDPYQHDTVKQLDGENVYGAAVALRLLYDKEDSAVHFLEETYDLSKEFAQDMYETAIDVYDPGADDGENDKTIRQALREEYVTDGA